VRENERCVPGTINTNERNRRPALLRDDLFQFTSEPVIDRLLLPNKFHRHIRRDELPCTNGLVLLSHARQACPQPLVRPGTVLSNKPFDKRFHPLIERLSRNGRGD
jgi:hypothetical protein